jgi:endonuclease YncB( thermonuclease family)
MDIATPFLRRPWQGRIRTAVLAAFLANPAAALAPAAETSACSLENATPATVAVVENNGELLLDDGRRAALSGVEFPPAGGAAHKRLSQWLAGQDVFIRAFSGAPDRWGRTPAAFFAAQGSDAAAPIVSVGAALLEEGFARFRPDPPAAPCATEYRAAEAIARDARRGIWADAAMLPVSAGEGARSLLQRKGMVVLEGQISSFGESRGLVFLNFGQKRAEAVSIVVLRRNLAMLQGSGIDPAGLVGRKVRVRGLIETGFGPRIEVSTPAEIEILDSPAP